jgi:hypothetical protein
MSHSGRMPRNRRKTSWLALYAALILVALLTGCSSGQHIGGVSGWSAIEVQGTEQALDTTPKTSVAEAALTQEGTKSGFHNAGFVDNEISGHAYDAAGEALEGVYIYIRVVPESYGELYQTTTDADGAYSYSVPEGVYLILAEYNPNDDPEGGVYLEPIKGDGSVTVPPSAQVDFQLSS